MPRFTRHKGYYTYEPRNLPRRYVIKKDETGWVAEAYKVEDGAPGELKMKHSAIPMKRDAVKLVDFWMDKRL